MYLPLTAAKIKRRVPFPYDADVKATQLSAETPLSVTRLSL